MTMLSDDLTPYGGCSTNDSVFGGVLIMVVIALAIVYVVLFHMSGTDPQTSSEATALVREAEALRMAYESDSNPQPGDFYEKGDHTLVYVAEKGWLFVTEHK